MALFRCSHRSKLMAKRMEFNLVLPEDCAGDVPVVMLLHGLSGNHNEWLENCPLQKLAAQYGVAFLLPDGTKSWYCDQKYGDPFCSYIRDELLDYARSVFPLSRRREKTFVAGLSMGAYGALKMALGAPDRFAACGAMSGAVDIRARMSLGDKEGQARAIWGDDYLDAIPGSPDDTYHLVRQLEAAGLPRPWIYQSCGTEDKRLGENHLFREFIKDRGYVYEYYEGPGRHNWDFWGVQILEVLDFFMKCMEANGVK